MNYNGKLTRRINNLIRNKIWIPRYKKRIQNHEFSLICNNCNGGFMLHDCGEEFRTPTINLFFPEFGFFDFVENLRYYLDQELEPYEENSVTYPCAKIGGSEYKEIIIHFMHYGSFEEAKHKWNTRKERINWNDLYIIWTFFGDTWEELFDRFEKLPVKHKVAFVNRPYSSQYRSLFYIKGFEKDKGLGLLSSYQNLLGKRYYDQFDFVKWFNTGEW